MNSQRNELGIPRFSIKSALLLLGAGLIGGVGIPFIFYLLNWNTHIATMLFLPLLIAGALAYSQSFIENNYGFCKRFWLTFTFAFIILEILSYFWLFQGFIF